MTQKSGSEDLRCRLDSLARRERALRVERDRLETLLSALDTGLSLINPDKTIAWVNAKTRRMFPHGEPVGKICHQFYESSPEVCPSCPSLKCFETGRVQEAERFNPADGRWYRIVSQPIIDDSGRVRQVLEGVTDITRQKHNYQALKDQLEFSRTLLETLPNPIFVKNIHGRYIGCNPAFEELTGTGREEIIGKTVFEMGPPEIAEIYHQKDQALFEAPGVQSYEWKVRRRDGEIRDVVFNKATFRDSEGRIAGLIGVVLDVTKHKQLEAELAEYSRRLEDMVDERGRELRAAQHKLILKEREAVLSHIAGSMSHEIRNPLAAIDSSVYYLGLRLGDGDDKVREHLDRITANVAKATEIIESLLNLTRMEPPKTRPHDLAALVLATVGGAEIPETVAVIPEAPETPVRVSADADQIRMAVKQIIDNAVQAMNGVGTITLTIRPVDPGQAELAISDTGPGIPPADLDRVFEPLFTTKAQGIGFGLSITQIIIENHGGGVRAESDEKGGAVFVLTLPRVQAEGKTT